MPKVWIALQQAPKRSRISPTTQKGVEQGLEDKKLQVSTVRACNQRVTVVLRGVGDSRAYNKISRLKSAILQVSALVTQRLRCILWKDHIYPRRKTHATQSNHYSHCP